MAYSNFEGTTEYQYSIGNELVYLEYLQPGSEFNNNNLQGMDLQGKFPLATILDRGMVEDNDNTYTASGTSWYTFDLTGSFTPKYTGKYILNFSAKYYSSGNADVKIIKRENSTNTPLYTITDLYDGGTLTKSISINLTQNQDVTIRIKMRTSWWRYSIKMTKIFIECILYRFGNDTGL